MSCVLRAVGLWLVRLWISGLQVAGYGLMYVDVWYGLLLLLVLRGRTILFRSSKIVRVQRSEKSENPVLPWRFTFLLGVNDLPRGPLSTFRRPRFTEIEVHGEEVPLRHLAGMRRLLFCLGHEVGVLDI